MVRHVEQKARDAVRNLLRSKAVREETERENEGGLLHPIGEMKRDVMGVRGDRPFTVAR